MTILTGRYPAAVGYAAAVHATQVRKGTAVPCLAHLLGVSSLVLESGGDEDLAIAALLRLGTASDDALVVWSADKVHNCRAVVTDLRVHGSDVLSTFHGTPEQILWYSRENLALASERAVRDSLVLPLRDAVGQLTSLIG